VVEERNVSEVSEASIITPEKSKAIIYLGIPGKITVGFLLGSSPRHHSL
jgi:hypothetical protein